MYKWNTGVNKFETHGNIFNLLESESKSDTGGSSLFGNNSKNKESYNIKGSLERDRYGK